MKVVIFAGGLGTRMREETEFKPKPMIEIGGKPVLWHIMKIFAHYGHTDFIICAGYKGNQIKDYFYNYAANTLDFTMKLGDRDSAVFHGSHDEFDWTVTVAETGQNTQTGGRLSQVRKYLGDEPFLCTYGDGVAPVDINRLIGTHKAYGKTGTMTVTQPRSRFGVVETGNSGIVTSFREKPVNRDLVNIGFFVFEPEIFQLLNEESVLEESPLKHLAQNGELGSFKHDGFWQPMDTFREFQDFNSMWESGESPWKIWGK